MSAASDETCSLMIVSERRDCPVKAMTSDDFELVEVVAPDAERIDDRPLLSQEFDVVQPAEGGGVVILAAAGETEVDPFDLERQARHVIGAERKLKRAPERFDEGDDQRRGRAEAGAGRNVDRRRHRDRQPDPAAEALHHARIDGAVQHQPLADGQVRIGIERFLLADIRRPENDLVAAVAGGDMRIGEAVDGRVQDGAAVLVAVGRKIRPAAGQPQPERSARPNVEHFPARQNGGSPVSFSGGRRLAGVEQRRQYRPGRRPGEPSNNTYDVFL